ncbi:exocyst complex component 3 [Agrilus planipennis]|uniref:Exocyst complex component 3 n=1 Tax=Agrilus planipennis TaxID=224129 RepID=A0A1W4XIG9_AGRPL|nr:exocyst complex component 3 [Agrilus planipennis]
MAEVKSKCNIRQLEAEAKISAVNHVTNMLQRPGQLEKIEQYKRGLIRKKGSNEALLKSAMQSHLDGVRVGQNQLQACLEDVRDIETNLKSLASLFKDVPDLRNKLNEVREENMKHSQYVTARENLKHIFTVPESIEKTKQWINEGKLLHAHQCLRDLENSRDELLFELHKLPNQSPHDKVMLKAYFSDVETLSGVLEKQLRLILSRTLNTVRKEPTVIVTALRIIEREENVDEESLKQEKQNGFLPPGRPKKWRAMAFEVLEKSVATRIEGTQVEERDDNKLWLVRYLELLRQLMLEDLRVVKTLCIPCFPPSYEILDRYIKMYHACLSRHLQEVIQNGLQGNEYVSLLSWVLNTYKGEELLGHPDLKESTENVGTLLPKTVLDDLQGQYLTNMKMNYNEWMQNTVTSEKQEWRSNKPPEEPRVDGYLRTATPIIIFQMIDQNLQVSKTISQEFTNQALLLSLEQIVRFANGYKEAIIEFKNKHFEDRSQVPYFTHHMITVLNNCMQIIELGAQFEKQYLNMNTPRLVAEAFQKLRDTILQLRNESGEYLLEEVFLDLEKHFEELFSSRWLLASIPVDTICATLEDYFQDYNRLTEENFDYVITQARKGVTKRYLTAMLSRKVSFKTYEECLTAAKKIAKEVEQLNRVFCSNLPNIEEKENQLDVIKMMSEILKCEDDMISFDLHRIVEKYPDITEDQLHRLLSLRGDLPRSELKEKVLFVTKTSKPKSPQPPSIFRELILPDRILNW